MRKTSPVEPEFATRPVAAKIIGLNPRALRLAPIPTYTLGGKRAKVRLAEARSWAASTRVVTSSASQWAADAIARDTRTQHSKSPRSHNEATGGPA
jgi:hypothetical protein